MKKRKKTAKKPISPDERAEFLSKLEEFLRDKDVGALVIADAVGTYTYTELGKKELGHLIKELASIQRAASFALQEVRSLS